MDDVMVAVGASKQGLEGEDSMSGLMFAEYFVGISETPEGLQKQIEKALEYTRKWRVTANVDKCGVVLCHEEDENPVYSIQMGVAKTSITDCRPVHVPRSRNLKKECYWDARTAKGSGTG